MADLHIGEGEEQFVNILLCFNFFLKMALVIISMRVGMFHLHATQYISLLAKWRELFVWLLLNEGVLFFIARVFLLAITVYLGELLFIKNFKLAVTGWESSSYATYKDAFEKYGGSVNMHPDVIEYFTIYHNWQFDFFHYKKGNLVKGAYFICNNKTIGVMARRDFPLSSDEIIIPMSPDLRCFLPERTNKLSTLHQAQVINATWKIARKKQNCLIKESFSSKFEKTRRNECQRFLRSGGSVKNIDDFSCEEIVQIYISLFRSRFGDSLPCYARDNLTTFISHLRHILFGHVLYFENTPCAFDIVLKSESDSHIYFDVPNGGVKKECMNLSPGSILMWLNVGSAKGYCKEKQKKLIFSIGALRPEWEYKLRWAVPHFMGKSLC